MNRSAMGSVAAVMLMIGAGRAASPTPPAAPATTFGIPVGEHAPSFTLKDQDGKERTLDEFLKNGKVAIVFHRSARW